MSPRALRSLVLAAAFATSATASAGSFVWDGTTSTYTLTSSDDFSYTAGASGAGGLAVTARDLDITGNLTLGGAFSFTQTGGGSLYQGIDLIGASSTITATAITLTGDIGKQASNGGTLALDTSAANGAINLNVSLGRSGVWYVPAGLTASAGTGTITISGANSSGWRSTPVTLSGGAVNFSGSVSSDAAVSVTNSLASSISNGAVLSGSMSLAKSGAGTLTISNGSNSFTGNITINAGRVVVAAASGTAQGSSPSNSALGNMTTAGRTITVGNGAGSTAVLEFANSDAIGAYNYATPVTFIADGGTITRHSSTTFNSIGAITLRNGGKVVTTNGNASTVGSFAFNGTITVDGTSATASSIEPLSGQTSNNYINLGTVGGSTTFNITNTTAANALTVTTRLGDKVLGGAAGLVKNGAGTMTLAAANSFTGNLTVNAGELRLAAATSGNSTAAGDMSINGRVITVNSGATLKLINADVLAGYNSKPVASILLDGGTLWRQGKEVSGSAYFNSLGDITLRNGATIRTGTGNAQDVQALAFNGTVTVDGTTGSSIVASSGTSLNGIHLGTVGGSTTFNVADTSSADDLAVGVQLANKVLGGAASLVKAGAGRMSISVAGAYSGGTTLRAGTLVAANSTALGTGAVTVNDASTSTSNTTLLLDATSAAVDLTRAVTVANQGSGTVTLGSATASGSSQAIFSGAITLNKATTLTGGSSGDRLGFTGGITGTANVTIAGTNRVVFSGSTVNYAGTTTINSGSILQLSDGTSTGTSYLADAQDVTVNGTLNLAKGANNETIGGLNGSGTVNQLVAGAATLTVGSGGGSGTFSGSLTNTAGTLGLTKSGAGTQTLTGASTHTGATTVSNGTLALGTGGSLGNTAVSIASGATLSTAAGTTVTGTVALASGAALRGSGSIGATTVANGTASLTAGNGTSGSLTFSSLTFDGAAILSIGTLANYTSASAFVITNALALNGANVTLALPAGVITNGTYKLLSYGSTSATEANFTVSGPVIGARQSGGLENDTVNKVFQYVVAGDSPKWVGSNGSAFSGGNNWQLITNATTTDFQTNDSLLLDDTASSYTVDISGGDVAPAAIAFDNSAANYVLQGDSGLSSGTLAKSGSGDLRISNANTASSVAISGGSVTLDNAGALGSSAVTLSGGALDLNGLSTSAAIALAGGSIVGNGAVNGVISGAGALAKSSAGTLTLGAQNTFTGGTTVSDGVLALGHATNTLADAGAVTVSGGELSLGSNADTVGAVTVSGGSVTGSGTLTGSSYAVTGGSVSAKLGGAGALTKSGAGAATLSGANSYSGGTTITAGTLNVGDDAALGSGSVALDGGTLALSGQTLANALVLGGGAVSGNGTISGAVSGASGLVKSGAGQLTLSSASTFTGGITLSGGSLSISSTLGAGSSYAGSISLSGALALTGNANQTLSGVISGASGFTKSGTGTLTLSGGSSSLTGDILISGGKVAVTSASSTAQGTSPTVSGLGNMTVARTITVDGVGSILEFAPSDVMGAFGYASPVTLAARNGGVITRTASGFNSIGAVALSEGGVLRANAGSNSTVNSFSLNGNVTVTGATAGGSIEATAGNFNGIHLRSVGSSGNITFTVADTAAVADLAVSASLLNPVQVDYLGYASNGTTAGIIKAGSGRMELTAANTYSGNTTINAGTLAVGSGGGIYRGGYRAAAITVASGATLELQNWQYNESATASLGGLSALASSIYVSGGTIRIVGTTPTTYGRGVTVNSGGVTLEAAAGASWTIDTVTDSQAWVYNGNPSVTLGGDGTGTFQKVLGLGTGSVTKVGSGNWTLSGANTYSGGTTVSDGTLVLGNAAALGTGTVTVSGGVLDLNNLAPTNIIVLSGGSLLNESAWAASGSLQVTGSVDSSFLNSLPTAEIKVAAGATVNLAGVTKDIVFEGGSLSNLSGYQGKLKVKGSLDLSSVDPQGEIEVAAGGTVDFGSRASSKAVKFTGGSVAGANFTGDIEVVGSGIALGSGIQAGTVRLTSGNSATIQSGFSRDIAFAGGSLSGLSNYSGTVSLETGATLSVGDTTTADFTLASGSTLKGSGSVGTITQSAGSTLAPGNSPGTLTADTLILAGGADMEVEFFDPSAAAGTGYDTAVVGELDLSALSSANRYTLRLVSLSALPSTQGALAGFDPTQSFAFQIFDYTNLTLPTGYTVENIAQLFILDLSGFDDQSGNPVVSGFSLSNNLATGAVDLIYAPIPEPSTYGLILGGLALAGVAVRRRRTKA